MYRREFLRCLAGVPAFAGFMPFAFTHEPTPLPAPEPVVAVANDLPTINAHALGDLLQRLYSPCEIEYLSQLEPPVIEWLADGK